MRIILDIPDTDLAPIRKGLTTVLGNPSRNPQTGEQSIIPNFESRNGDDGLQAYFEHLAVEQVKHWSGIFPEERNADLARQIRELQAQLNQPPAVSASTEN